MTKTDMAPKGPKPSKHCNSPAHFQTNGALSVARSHINLSTSLARGCAKSLLDLSVSTANCSHLESEQQERALQKSIPNLQTLVRKGEKKRKRLFFFSSAAGAKKNGGLRQLQKVSQSLSASPPENGTGAQMSCLLRLAQPTNDAALPCVSGKSKFESRCLLCKSPYSHQDAWDVSRREYVRGLHKENSYNTQKWIRYIPPSKRIRASPDRTKIEVRPLKIFKSRKDGESANSVELSTRNGKYDSISIREAFVNDGEPALPSFSSYSDSKCEEQVTDRRDFSQREHELNGSPPSFREIKDSDADSNDQASEQCEEQLSSKGEFETRSQDGTNVEGCLTITNSKIAAAEASMKVNIRSSIPPSEVDQTRELEGQKAPQVYFVGETVVNLEAELARGAKIKCSSCGKKGAALGCYAKSCRRSFHVPCAVEVSKCRWDFFENSTAIWTDSSKESIEWVVCGSALSSEDKELLSEFSALTGVRISKTWSANVTHVIASTNEMGACTRTLKFLMAILSGRWILKIDWIKACMEAKHPVCEEPYEISCDIHGSCGGPKNGRIRVMEKAPKLLNGLSFYFSGDFMPSYRGYLQDLVVAAGGSVLMRKDMTSCNSTTGAAKTTFVLYNHDSPKASGSTDSPYALERRRSDAEAIAGETGSQVVGYAWLLDSIAACSLLPICP
ncbi:hypothetical protein ACLOJK_007889 [Asimina triloba]